MQIYADMDPNTVRKRMAYIIFSADLDLGSGSGPDLRYQKAWIRINIQHCEAAASLRWRTTCLELSVGGEKAPPVAGAAGQHHQLTRQQAGVERLGHEHLLGQKSVQQTSKNEYYGSMHSNQMLGRSRVLLL
jgi:hypothetical protein